MKKVKLKLQNKSFISEILFLSRNPGHMIVRTDDVNKTNRDARLNNSRGDCGHFIVECQINVADTTDQFYDYIFGDSDYMT